MSLFCTVGSKRALVKSFEMAIAFFGVLSLAVLMACASNPTKRVEPLQGQVYYYEPEVVTLEGTLTREIFPGPPEYSDIKQGDEPEPFWILNLDQPISVLVKNGEDELNTLESGVNRLQLVMDYERIVPKKIGFEPGKKARIVGTLFHSFTIHHRTDVLLTVNEVKLIN